jgi:N6-L-threonylcarbamoyladenine synthase
MFIRISTIPSSVEFPYMVLLASGGHCILGIVEDVNRFFRLGETKDIAPGEAFDKVKRVFAACIDHLCLT